MDLQQLEEALRQFGGSIRSGKHDKGEGEVCARELRAHALGMRWTDIPDGGSPTDRVCQIINDADWSSDDARTENCLPLALLTESEALDDWVKVFTLSVIREILPPVFRDTIGLPEVAHDMEKNPCHETAWNASNAAAAAYAASPPAAAAAAASAAAASTAAASAAAASTAAASTAAASTAAASLEAAHAAARAAAHAAAWAARASSSKGSDSVLQNAVRLLLIAHGREDLV